MKTVIILALTISCIFAACAVGTTNCLTCNGTTGCTGCDPDYFIKEAGGTTGICLKTTPATAAGSCTAATVANPPVCTTCDATKNYFFNTGNTCDLLTNCTAANSAGAKALCTTCGTGYRVS